MQIYDLGKYTIESRFGTVHMDGDLRVNGSQIEYSEDDTISDTLLKYIANQIEKYNVFFITEFEIEDEELDDDAVESLMKLTSTIDFEDDEHFARAYAAAEAMGEKLSDIEKGYDSKTFEYGDSTLYVYTDDEADEAARESISNLIEDVGYPFPFSYDYVQEDWFVDFYKEYFESYVEDIENESSRTHLNRLEEEMDEEGILEIPDEPERDDYDSDEEYDEAIEAWEEARKEEIENKKEEFVTAKVDGIRDPIEEFKSEFGDEYFNETVKNNNLVDEDELIDAIIRDDGRGNTLASYDGEEREASFTLKGQKYFFYVYRS